MDAPDIVFVHPKPPADLRSDETKYFHAEIKRAVDAERERCANLAEARCREFAAPHIGYQVACAIRGRRP